LQKRRYASSSGVLFLFFAIVVSSEKLRQLPQLFANIGDHAMSHRVGSSGGRRNRVDPRSRSRRVGAVGLKADGAGYAVVSRNRSGWRTKRPRQPGQQNQ
jgi:hypothetical protein